MIRSFSMPSFSVLKYTIYNGTMTDKFVEVYRFITIPQGVYVLYEQCPLNIGPMGYSIPVLFL